MSFFRDDEYDKKQIFIPTTPLEHLESARWYHWCNCPLSAMRELDAVARSIEEVTSGDAQEGEEPSYEEMRFDKENDRRNWE